MVVAASCTALALAAPVVPAVAAAAHTASPPQTMLVFLRGPGGTGASGGSASPRVQSAAASLARSLGGSVLARTSVPDTLTVRLSAQAAAQLARNPLVAQVLPDVSIPGPTVPRGAERVAGTRRGPVTKASCGTSAHPQLNPEALGNIDAPRAWAAGATGKGVTVAILADGLDPSNADLLRSRTFASPTSPKGAAAVQYVDFSGDGAYAQTGGEEAFGDASSIVAQGNASYDLSRYATAAHPLPAHCDIRVVGDAPGATVLALKIFASNNATTGSAYVQAINYAVTHGANVINESFGSNAVPDTATDIIRAADDAAIAAGVLVVASSGDGGVNSTIGTPASDPAVLSVGATTTFRSYVQTTSGGINAPGANGRYLDDNISSISSGGFTTSGGTVNLVAPGDLNWSLCSTNPTYQDCQGAPVVNFGGTSEASPLTAGAAADVIQAYAATHHGQHPSVALLSRILTSSARDIHAPADQQGAGLLDIGAAVALARSLPGSVVRHEASVLASISQGRLEGSPGHGVAQHFTVTNTGASTTQLQLSARALTQTGVVAGRVVLNPAVRTTQPKFIVWSGAKEIYQRATFKVPAGLDRLRLTASYQFKNQDSALHVALFDPHGTYAGYSDPQGFGGFADVEVARPVPGKWSAVFFTVWNGWQHGTVGTSGPVPWSAAFLRFRAVGSVSPSRVTLPAGHSVGVTFREALPGSPGDSSVTLSIASTTVASRSSTTTTIPVVVRTMIPIGARGGTFHGVLLGGNGRGGAPAQQNAYDFVVPAGKHDLDASLRLATNGGAGAIRGDQVIALLVDPANQVAAYDSNYTNLVASNDTVLPYLNLYKASPVAGNWRLLVYWVQPLTGVRNSLGFAGAVRFNQVSALTTLPDSALTTVSKSAGATYGIQITNTGVAPMLVAPDARTLTDQVIALPDATGANLTQQMPNASNQFFVPTETKSINVQVAGTTPMTFDAGTMMGDPDFSPTTLAPDVSGSVTPTLAAATYAPTTGVTPGVWGVAPAEVGPYGSSGAPSASETTQVLVDTLGFDPSVTSSVPDTVYELMTHGAIAPDVVGPGGTDVITIRIAPTAAVGTTVVGTLFLTGLTTGALFGNGILDTGTAAFTSELAAFPYEYQVSS